MDNNLTVNYLGLTLKSPVIVGACPWTINLEAVRQMVCAGAGAVVLPSVFEEQLAERYFGCCETSTEDAKTAPDRALQFYNGGPKRYLQILKTLKAVGPIPIFGSLHGAEVGSWLRFAEELAAAGADAIELNFQPNTTNPRVSSDEVEQKVIRSVREIRSRVSIPISVKLTPFYTSLPHLTGRLIEAGADGVVLFGHQPTWDTDLDTFQTAMRWGLTPPGAVATTFSGLNALRPAYPRLSIAGGGGVSSPNDFIKLLVAGANVVMIASVLYREGPNVIRVLLDGLASFLERHHCASLQELPAARSHAMSPSFACQRRYLTDAITSDTVLIPGGDARAAHAGDRWGHPIS